jgi:hypothetical protein
LNWISVCEQKCGIGCEAKYEQICGIGCEAKNVVCCELNWISLFVVFLLSILKPESTY